MNTLNDSLFESKLDNDNPLVRIEKYSGYPDVTNTSDQIIIQEG